MKFSVIIKISEIDLKLRGPGDVLGTRQSGDLGFKLGDIVLKINGHEIDKVSTLKKLVAHTKDSWKVLIKRGDDVLSLLVPG